MGYIESRKPDAPDIRKSFPRSKINAMLLLNSYYKENFNSDIEKRQLTLAKEASPFRYYQKSPEIRKNGILSNSFVGELMELVEDMQDQFEEFELE